MRGSPGVESRLLSKSSPGDCGDVYPGSLQGFFFPGGSPRKVLGEGLEGCRCIMEFRICGGAEGREQHRVKVGEEIDFPRERRMELFVINSGASVTHVSPKKKRMLQA